MKKTFSKVLCLVMAMVMVFALSACGMTDEEKIVGTWETEVDLSETLNGIVASVPMIENQITFSNMYLHYNLDFAEDGTYDLHYNEDEIEEFYTNLVTNMVEYIDAQLEGTMFAGSGEKIAKTVINKDIIKRLANAISWDGMYKFEEGKLYVTDDNDGDFDEDDCITYSFKGNDTLILGGEDDDIDENLKDLFPMTFKRAE